MRRLRRLHTTARACIKNLSVSICHLFWSWLWLNTNSKSNRIMSRWLLSNKTLCLRGLKLGYNHILAQTKITWRLLCIHKLNVFEGYLICLSWTLAVNFLSFYSVIHWSYNDWVADLFRIVWKVLKIRYEMFSFVIWVSLLFIKLILSVNFRDVGSRLNRLKLLGHPIWINFRRRFNYLFVWNYVKLLLVYLAWINPLNLHDPLWLSKLSTRWIWHSFWGAWLIIVLLHSICLDRLIYLMGSWLSLRRSQIIIDIKEVISWRLINHIHI